MVASNLERSGNRTRDREIQRGQFTLRGVFACLTAFGVALGLSLHWLLFPLGQFLFVAMAFWLVTSLPRGDAPALRIAHIARCIVLAVALIGFAVRLLFFAVAVLVGVPIIPG